MAKITKEKIRINIKESNLKIFRNSKVIITLMIAALLVVLGASNILSQMLRPNKKILFWRQPPALRIRDCWMF